GDTNSTSDVYVRDVFAGTSALVSVNADGRGSGNGPSWGPLISADGRYVVFESAASNLVTNDFNGTNDIFIRDLTLGVTTLVSLNLDGSASANGPSDSPAISANGLFVAFPSQANDLVVGATNRLGEIYVRDLAGGSNVWAMGSHLQATHDRLTGAYRASQPVLSVDGRFVAFKTPGQVVRFDLQRPTNTVLLSFLPDSPFGDQSNYFRFDDNPRLASASSESSLSFSADGRYLVYIAKTNVVSYPGIIRVDFDSFQTNVAFCCEGSLTRSYFTNQVPVGELVVTNNASLTGQVSWCAINSDASRLFFL